MAERLDVRVAALIDALSRSRAAALVKEGRVRVDGRVVTRPSTAVGDAQQVEVDLPDPVPAEARPQDLPLTVVYEDPHIAVIDKAAGMVVHPAAGHADGTLVNALLHHLTDLSGVNGVQRPGIVHRLDRGTSGLIVVAKHDEAHRALADQFATHRAGRVYLALCHGVPDDAQGTVVSELARHPTDRLRWASTAEGRGKRAVTHWWRVGHAGRISLLRCELETGRTHQVRVHLSEQGWPLVGDLTYQRGARPLPASLRGRVDRTGARPMLHAWRLRLTHPVDGGELRFEVPPPSDMAEALAALGLELPPR